MSESSTLAVQAAELEFKLAIAWQHQGQLARAAAGYRKAIALQPEYIPAYMELANLLETSGKLTEAIEVYRRAVECNPSDSGLRTKLTSLLCKQEKLTADPAVKTNSRQATAISSPTQRGQVLFYSDRPGIMGAEQINHLLMCGLVTAGYRVTCAQNKTVHHLITEREQLGIRHVWLAVDDVFDTKKSRALNDTSEPQAIVTAVKPDLIIFGDGCPLSSLTAKLVASRLGIPYIALVHCATPAWAKHFALYLEKLATAYEQAAAVIAVSQENLDLLRQLFGLPQSKGQVIYNGRPAAYFAPPSPATRQHFRQQFGIPSEAVVCFTSARMDFVKGYQHQIEAVKQLRQSDFWPRLYFVWAGAGSIESRLRAMAMKINADSHLKFLGERPDVAELLDVADMFILPSHWEGMPLSIMEAMAKGLPVMASAVSGVPEELGTTGKLLPNPELNTNATVEEMIATISLWATDSQLRQQIGRECKQRAEEKFRAERMLAEYVQLVDRTLPSLVSVRTVTEAVS
jgi:glycosyltransferase involved in cell wall biosynthesis